MRFSALLLTSLVGYASAFAPAAPTAFRSSKLFVATEPEVGAVAAGSIDRSMVGIDAKGEFDPTEGDGAALKRNNNGEVWVSQVCIYELFILCVRIQVL